MSHNVTLGNVKIDDMSALGQAVKELSKELNVPMELVKDGAMRGYSGRTTKADYVLRLPSCRYDVGFHKQADGSYAPVGESMGGRDYAQIIGTQPGTKTVGGEACDSRSPESFVGRLVQRCNVVKAENEAARAGMTTSREYDAKTGIMNLVCTGA